MSDVRWGVTVRQGDKRVRVKTVNGLAWYVDSQSLARIECLRHPRQVAPRVVKLTWKKVKP